MSDADDPVGDDDDVGHSDDSLPDWEFLGASGIDPTSLDPPSDELASFAQRAMARSVDLLVVAVLSLALLAPQLQGQPGDGSVPRWAKIAVAVVWLGYEAATTALLGQTMGKLATGCRVADRHTGDRPGFARSVVRAAVIPGLIPLLGVFSLLAYFSAMFDRREHRGLLDRLAGTVVVKATPGVRGRG